METKKERFIKIIKRVLIGLSVGLNVFFLIAMIIGGASVKKTNKLNKFDNVSENVNFIKENKKFVSYSDVTSTIILSVDELTNYTWTNLYSYFEDNVDDAQDLIPSISYDVTDLNFDENGTDFWTWLNIIDEVSKYYIEFDSNAKFNFNYAEYNSSVDDYQDNEVNSFQYSIILNCDVDYYADIKSAIELDIQANSGTMTDGIFETLTESTVSFIGTLGSGIVAMTSVFYDSANSQLTTIGLLSVIVVAISLSYFLFRLIIGLIRMRG